MRAVLLYATAWATFTTVLRPLAGQGVWEEVFERGGNIGLPLALLILVGLGSQRSIRSWFEKARPRVLTPSLATTFNIALADAGVAAWDAKFAYWNPRPENGIRDLGLDPNWKPLLPTPRFLAYPSGSAGCAERRDSGVQR